MSHKASHWLAEISPTAMNHGAFRVMFHLCDAHNSKRPPETACFPSQEKLMEATGLSNGGLNNALNELEKAGLLIRRRTRNPDGTKGPTYYILGCDFCEAYPSPKNGDGDNAETEQEQSDAIEADLPPKKAGNHLHFRGSTISNKGPKPSPLSGDKPVKEPIKEPYAGASVREDAPTAGQVDLDTIAEKWVGPVKAGRTYAGSSISLRVAHRMLERKLVTLDELKFVGINL